MNLVKLLVSTDQVYSDMYVGLPWWMPMLHGAYVAWCLHVWGSSHHWAGILFYVYSIGFEDCGSLLNRLSLLNMSL